MTLSKNKNNGHDNSHHDEESSSTWRSVCRPLSPIDEGCVVPIWISSSNDAALFGQLHQVRDERTRVSSRSIARTRPMTRNGPTNDHCGNHDDYEDDAENDATTTINVIRTIRDIIKIVPKIHMLLPSSTNPTRPLPSRHTFDEHRDDIAPGV
jgi:hypothetical protein